MGEPAPSGSPISAATVRHDVVETLYQLIETLTELSGAGSIAEASLVSRDLPLLLDVSEAAHMMSLSRAKVSDMASHGEIPSIRIGRSVRIPRDPLVAWIEKHTNPVEHRERVHLPRWARSDRSPKV